MELEFAQATDCGRIRDHNEDYMGCALPETAEREQTHGWLFALADGVGGQEQGEVASRTAVETLLAEFRRAGRDQPLRALMPRLVQSANEKVFETGLAAKPRGAAMATTLVACALRYDRAVISHVGDSRCYLLRGGRARVLTRDHTAGGGAETRQVLTRSLGSAMFVGTDTAEHLVLAGDVLLLSSDGLHGALAGAEIAEIAMREADLETAARELVDAAKDRDGSDNISVQLIRVRSVERIGIYRGRPYKLA